MLISLGFTLAKNRLTEWNMTFMFRNRTQRTQHHGDSSVVAASQFRSTVADGGSGSDSKEMRALAQQEEYSQWSRNWQTGIKKQDSCSGTGTRLG